MKNDILALVGALVGAVAGVLGFRWLLSQGFYGLILPGALIGIGASYFKSKSLWVCAVCGILALVAGLFAEWKFLPFRADQSLAYFLTHLQSLQPMTWIMLIAGVAVAYWFPFNRRLEMFKTTAPPPASSGSGQ